MEMVTRSSWVHYRSSEPMTGTPALGTRIERRLCNPWYHPLTRMCACAKGPQSLDSKGERRDDVKLKPSISVHTFLQFLGCGPASAPHSTIEGYFSSPSATMLAFNGVRVAFPHTTPSRRHLGPLLASERRAAISCMVPIEGSDLGRHTLSPYSLHWKLYRSP